MLRTCIPPKAEYYCTRAAYQNSGVEYYYTVVTAPPWILRKKGQSAQFDLKITDRFFLINQISIDALAHPLNFIDFDKELAGIRLRNGNEANLSNSGLCIPVVQKISACQQLPRTSVYQADHVHFLQEAC